MYKIEKVSYGFKLTFGGTILNDEMQQWYQESQKALAGQRGSFGVLVDMRTLKPLGADAQATMVKGQQQYQQAGMVRSAVILNDPVTTLQFRRLARESGIYQWERYIDASSTLNWEPVARSWLADGKEP